MNRQSYQKPMCLPRTEKERRDRAVGACPIPEPQPHVAFRIPTSSPIFCRLSDADEFRRGTYTSSALLTFFGEGSPTKIDDREKLVPLF